MAAVQISNEIPVPPYTMGQLIALTPLIQSPEHNLVRIERTDHLDHSVHLIASGPFKGIVINKLAKSYEDYATQFPCSFSVWISANSGKELIQEIRSFRFFFYPHVPLADRASSSQRFIRNIFERNFPKDYAAFFTLLLRLMQTDYPQFRSIDVETKFASEKERMPMPTATNFVNDGEMENVSVGHVREFLEHAYPNGVVEEDLADSLRCTVEEVCEFLEKLEQEGIVERVPNQHGEWMRKAYTIPEPPHSVVSKKQPPTIAIITCLFPEKICVDAIIDNSSTTHRYSKSGDSNVYTIGEIAGHRVVATKLSLIGTDRTAATSAGSITTRLLGFYQKVEHVIIVGVAGGQPHLTDPDIHIRLGDVVVSHGGIDEQGKQIGSYVYAHNVIYNWKTEEIDGFDTRDWSPNDNVLARTVRNADKTSFLHEWHKNCNSLVLQLNEEHKEQQLDYSRPSSDSDVILQLSGGSVLVFPHPNESRNTPSYHLGPVGAMVTFREKQPNRSNEPFKTPLKPTRRVGKTQNGDASNLEIVPSTVEQRAELASSTVSNVDSASEHTGRSTAELENTMGSGDLEEDDAPQTRPIPSAAEENNEIENSQLNERLREKFRGEYHLRAFDAGFDSVIAAIVGSRVDSWVLVRGVSDYQQGSSRQGKLWQHYAAANAVAMVKTILHNMPTQ